MISCLAQHAGYRCRHSGACCTSGWPIHVEADRVGPIEEALARGQVRSAERQPLVAEAGLPPGAGAVLRTTALGHCAFYDAGGRRCRVHAALGHDRLPVACQHFPRRCLIERDATFVSLSHYCPTVARMAFDDADRRGAVTAPSSLVGHLRLEGLDAREALPPLLRPGLLTDLAGYRRWEAAVVSALEDDAPERALGRVRAFTADLMAWQPRRGRFADAVTGAVERHRSVAVEWDGAARFDRWVEDRERARASSPGEMRPPRLDESLARADESWVRPGWSAFSRPVGRFVAAHAFGNWHAYFGTSLLTVVRALEAALAVVRVEAANQCRLNQRPIDREQLVEAFRAADLLLVHLADPKALAERIEAAERGGVPAAAAGPVPGKQAAGGRRGQ
jgi:Fe-S-cluster containining protein